MAALISIEAHHRNKSSKNKVALFLSCYFHFNSYLKQLLISNKTEHFSYKGGCGMVHIEAFKRKIGF